MHDAASLGAMLRSAISKAGARGGARTRMALRPGDFKSLLLTVVPDCALF